MFGFTFYTRNHILLENIVWKNLAHIITFYALQGIWNAVMIHQSSNGFALVSGPDDLWPEI